MSQPASRQPRRSGSPRRAVVLVAAMWSVLGAVLVAPVGPGGSILGAGEPGCAEAQSLNRIALVVDFGTVAGSPGSVTAKCIAVPPGTDGLRALTAAGYRLRFNSSGLLCSLAPPGGSEYPPAPDCGVRTGGGYRYWAYFTGTAAGWQHMGVGPGFRPVNPAAAEGWRFVEGAGRPGDPEPRAPSDPAATCPPAPATTVPAPVVPPVVPPTGGPAVPARPSAPSPAGGASPAADPSAGAGAGPGPEAARGDPAVDPAPGQVPAPGAPPDSDGAVSGDPNGSGAPTAADGSPPGSSGEGSAPEIPAEELAGAPVVVAEERAGAPWGVLAVVALAGVLGGLAAVRFRRSPDQ